MCLSAAMGLWLAPGIDSVRARTGSLLAGDTRLPVAPQHAQCCVERGIRRLMIPRGNRPLPAGRLGALGPRIALGIRHRRSLAIPIGDRDQPLTALLGCGSPTPTTCSLQPLQRRSPWALEIERSPARSLRSMGWTAATGSISLPGCVPCSGASSSGRDPALPRDRDQSRRGLPPLRLKVFSVRARRPSPRRAWLAFYTHAASSPSASSPARFTSRRSPYTAAAAVGPSASSSSRRGYGDGPKGPGPGRHVSLLDSPG